MDVNERKGAGLILNLTLELPHKLLVIIRKKPSVTGSRAFFIERYISDGLSG